MTADRWEGHTLSTALANDVAERQNKAGCECWRRQKQRKKTKRENKQTLSCLPFNSIWFHTLRSTLHFSLPPWVISDTHVQLEPNYPELHLSLTHMWKSLLHIEARLLVMMSSLITDLCFCHFTGLLTFMCWSNYLLWLSCQSIEYNNWCYETMQLIKPQSNTRNSGLVRQVRHKLWKREERLIGKLLQMGEMESSCVFHCKGRRL